MDAIQVAVFAAGDEKLFNQFFEHNSKLKHLSVTSNLDEFKNSVIAGTVAVVRVQSDGLDGAKLLADFLTERAVPFVCICQNTSEGFEMLQAGAHSMLTKPDDVEYKYFFASMATKIKAAFDTYTTDNSRVLKKQFGAFNKIIAIGSSTGGTETILKILQELPEDVPPILIVQHMPPVFTKLYAERLHASCSMSVWEAQDGDLLQRGLVLLAPGDFQMTLEERGGSYAVRCAKGEKVSGHCPSVDMLFSSVAKVAARKTVGVILTGMGADGANGLLELRTNGAMTLGQDEYSCVVYGMPKAAFDIGAVTKQVSLENMSKVILESIH